MHTRSTARVTGSVLRACPTPLRKEATDRRRKLLTACFIGALFLLAALLCAHAQAVIMESEVAAPLLSNRALPGYSAALSGRNPAAVSRRPLFLLVPATGEARMQLPPAGEQGRAAPTTVRLDLIWKPGLLLLLLLLLLTPRKQGRFVRGVRKRLASFLRRRLRADERSRALRQRKAAASMIGEECAKQAAPAALQACGPAGESPLGVALPATTFADVAGIDEVRAELEEIVQFLRSPQTFARLGARIPRGALLVGAPGTGKTLLARAVAGEADVPFLYISASELVEVFVGMGASRVRALFQRARHIAPAVIFIDEIDAVGRKRTSRAGGHEERDQTLNQLLVEMDGFCSSQAVVVLAATNRVDILDTALLRPGRFDRHINVPLPDCAGRQAILALHTARVPLHEEVDLSRLARLTTGMSGAELASLVNEAALCAVRRNLQQADHACFEQALARMQLGAQRPLVLTEAERRTIACHEGGHALVAYYLPEAGAVNGVTILPRGQSLGVTQLVAGEDRYNYSRQSLMTRIAVGLGGRAAEELMAGREQVTIGAESDFRSATALARRMVTRWGMGQEIGVTFVGSAESGAGLSLCQVAPTGSPSHARALALDTRGRLVPDGRPARGRLAALTTPAPRMAGSPGMSALVEREVRTILDEGYGMARQILQEHFDQLQVLADTLVEREQLNRAEFAALMSQDPAC